MSDFRKCGECGAYYWGADHKCPPVFLVADEHDPDYWERVHAHTHALAAEAHTKALDVDGYPVASEEYSLEVRVKREGEDTARAFRVSGHFEAHYSASEVDVERRAE